MMNAKENYLRTIKKNGEPEWIPFSEECPIFIPSCVRERPPFGVNGDDWYGCTWVWDETTKGFAQWPDRLPDFDDVTEWRDVVKFPDLDAIDWEAAAAKDLANFDRSEKPLRIFLESGPFERLHSLLSFEEALIAMYSEPEETKALLDAITDSRIALLEKLVTYYKPDIVTILDDLGTSRAPMMSVEMYQEFLKPSHKRIGDFLHSHGVIYQYHSCGRYQEFIGDLVDCGADMVYALQSMNDHEWVRDTYADKLAFEFGPDTVVNLPDTPEETLREITRKMLDIWGPTHSLIMDFGCASAVNKAIMIDEAKKYRSKFFNKA